MIFHARHLHERRLFECYVATRQGEPINPRVAEHLADCGSCGARYGELAAFLDGVRADAVAESDAAFTAERLRAQQHHIARRIEHLGRAARVIAFPRSGSADRASFAASVVGHRRPRWVAAAVAAGLFVGVALGASFEWERPSRFARDVVATVERVEPPPVDGTLAAVATDGNAPSNVAADEAFLSELEAALDRPRTLALQPFDEITPHVREVRAAIR